MIPTKIRESRRVKALKLPKNLDRLYKEGKCRECAVVVTRMDFAKILGKFTKVKIQYESSSTPKTKTNTDTTSPNSNARLKSNENGMVVIQRKTVKPYSERPFKDLQNSKNAKKSGFSVAPNILRENNRLKKPVKVKNTVYNDQKQKGDTNLKQYGIVFEDPLASNNNNNEINLKFSLIDLLPKIDDSILPTEEWCIDYFPKKDEPKDDQVYDRIAAELEDLMYNEKPIAKLDDKQDVTENNKVDDFPSIMDILNDNSSESKSNDQNNSLDFKSNLESSDVEAMLLGKPNAAGETVAPTPMEVDSTNMGHLIEDVNHLSTIQASLSNDDESGNSSEDILPKTDLADEIENPHSPSILDEALQKGIEEHIPVKQIEPCPEDNMEEDQTKDDIKKKLNTSIETEMKETEVKETEIKVMETNVDNENSESNDNIKSKDLNLLALKDSITHVVFKKTKEGICTKSVTCPKNLKYCIEIEEKSVEFLGAPKFITCLEDLQVLLQIVNESELDCLYVLH